MDMIVDFFLYKKNDGWKNIEDYFVISDVTGTSKALYCKCEGLENKGKPKNIVTETYADSDRVRVYTPDEIKRDTTTISLTMCFIGNNRQQVQQNFFNYINDRPIFYWDSARRRAAILLLEQNVNITEDTYLTNVPNICVEYTFKNLYGECPIYNTKEDGLAWASGVYQNMF